ncbi:hypothetical protein SK128_000801 [Halocaridina rubra]|uniref:Uncharacterized protein n=1 Tax=Halocaridina rubra TaxID=373956 RepID=A0AAN8ZTJ6_HALRR
MQGCERPWYSPISRRDCCMETAIACNMRYNSMKASNFYPTKRGLLLDQTMVFIAQMHKGSMVVVYSQNTWALRPKFNSSTLR